jgi:hypothetical protein
MFGRWGWVRRGPGARRRRLVRVALLGPRDTLSGAARHHADPWQGAVEPLTAHALDGSGLVVDALFGSGLTTIAVPEIVRSLSPGSTWSPDVRPQKAPRFPPTFIRSPVL